MNRTVHVHELEPVERNVIYIGISGQRDQNVQFEGRSNHGIRGPGEDRTGIRKQVNAANSCAFNNGAFAGSPMADAASSPVT